MVTNEQRAERIKRLAESYKGMTLLTNGDGKRTPIVDVLADIMHYCQRQKLNFKEMLAEATEHYDDEKD